MGPCDFMIAARVPETLEPQAFGLWEIKRHRAKSNLEAQLIGWESQTILYRWTEANIHLDRGEIVMEDGKDELAKHLPIWLKARGRILITGLGLGCVVRGLLANHDVMHIDVVELDRDILRIVGAEFAGNPRVTLHHGDALTIDLSGRWDFAWHDLWHEDGQKQLQLQHIQLMQRFHDRCGAQGAWGLPRLVGLIYPFASIGVRRRRPCERKAA